MLLSLAACGSEASSALESAETSTETSAETSTDSSAENSESASSDEVVINIDTSENAIQDLVTYQTIANELETFNVLYGQSASSNDVVTNLYDGLLTSNSRGELVANLAETWGTEDNGLTWTFNLRQNACWVDINGEKMSDLTSADFITGLEYVLNAAKNGAANTSMPIEMIVGAAEYYNYTAELVENGQEEEAYALAPDNEVFMEMVGIETPDEYTVVYHCVSEKPYFDSVATYGCLYPIPTALLEEIGAKAFHEINNETMWYSGPYIMTEFIHGNEKVYEPNPLWWGNDEYTRFNSVTVKMVDSLDVAYQLYQSGEIDNVSLSESNLSIIYNDPNSEFYNYLVETRPDKYSYNLKLNYNKMNEDGTPDVNWNTAIANEAFRLSWYYGLDLTEYYKRINAINPLNIENNAYTMKGFVYTSDGTDYTSLVLDRLGIGEADGETMVRLDADLAAQYKEQAMEELSALGVSFPVSIDYYIAASNQTALDNANVLARCFADSLGEDYVTLNIKSYVSSFTQEVRNPKLHSIYISGWGADYADPQNFLVQEVFGDDNAYFSASISNINDFYGDDAETPYSEELIEVYTIYTEMVREADSITDDLDARYEAYADAEAYMIEHALNIPLYFNSTWELTKINDYSKINCIYGSQNARYLNWETNVNGYTTAEYEAFAAEAAAE